MIPARDALERLREGNRRFVQSDHRIESFLTPTRRDELVSGQTPFATILGCSDSRAPVEIIFDQGLGDLFVIRVAGNIVAPSQIGSVEFAAARFETRAMVAMTVAVEQCQRLHAQGIHEYHFYTLNRAELTRSICHMLGVRAAASETVAAGGAAHV